jgi:dihydrofolate reductase
MRRIVVFENITLDGFMAGPNGEIDWAIRDDEVTQLSREGEGTTDTFMFGRVTYDMMAAFWPTPAGKEANPVFAAALNSAPKIVFSKTLKKPDWQGTEVMSDLNREEVLNLKGLPGKDVLIFGSGSIVNQLAEFGAVDEYQLLVNPVVLGKGKPLFSETLGRMSPEFLGSRVFRSGIVMLRYRPLG